MIMTKIALAVIYCQQLDRFRIISPLYPIIYKIYFLTWIDVSGLLCGSFCSWQIFLPPTEMMSGDVMSAMIKSTYVWTMQKFVLYTSQTEKKENPNPQLQYVFD